MHPIGGHYTEAIDSRNAQLEWGPSEYLWDGSYKTRLPVWLLIPRYLLLLLFHQSDRHSITPNTMEIISLNPVYNSSWHHNSPIWTGHNKNPPIRGYPKLIPPCRAARLKTHREDKMTMWEKPRYLPNSPRHLRICSAFFGFEMMDWVLPVQLCAALKC